MPTADPPDEMRLDALAATAGVATTTVRLYQNRGLLPGPRLVGRTGWYSSSHLARLRLIAQLQDQGFGLAGIAKLLDSWEQGRDLTDLVDVEEELGAVLTRPAAVVVGSDELSNRFPAGALTPEVVQRAARMGLVEPNADGRVRIPDRRFLEVGSELARMGVPVEVVLDQWERLLIDIDEVAARFVEVFEAHLLPPGWQQLDPESIRELAGTLSRLQHHAGQVLLAALDASMARAAAERLGQLTGGEESTDA